MTTHIHKSLDVKLQIVGGCMQPHVELNILQTDYDHDGETVNVYINNQYLGNCTKLTAQCSYRWKELTIDCDPVDMEYTLDVSTSNSSTKQFGCDEIDCSVGAVWDILGDCPVATVSMSMHMINIEVDGNERVFINDHSLGECESSGMNYSYSIDSWVDCLNIQSYPIYDYLRYNYSRYFSDDKYIFVYIDGSGVYENVSASGSYYILANVTVGCENVDYQFDLGLSGTYTWPQDDPDDKNGKFSCDYNGNPRLTLSIMDMNYRNANFTININGYEYDNNFKCNLFLQETSNCSDSNEWLTCLYDLSYYVDETADLDMVNYVYLTIATNNDIVTLCPYNDTTTTTMYYLYGDVSLTCHVPDQCVLDSVLPQIITMVLITLSVATAIGVIIAGTFAAYKKGQEKALQQFVQASVLSRSDLKDDVNPGGCLASPATGMVSDDDADDMKVMEIRHVTTPTPNQPTTEAVLYSFCKYLPKEIMKKKSCYFPCITHLIDQSTDVAVIFEFYQLYVFESIPNPNGTKNDCGGVNAEQLLIISCVAFLFYRIISCIWIYNITRSIFHTILQFFDLKIYHALYINFISEYNDGNPNTAQKYIQILEASLEAFPQVVIQLYFFIQVEMHVSKYWIVFASLIMSLYNVASRMASEDRIYFIKSWQNVFDNRCLNFHYLFRCIVRVCDVFQRIVLILLLWIGVGGFYCALYIIFELIILFILSVVTREYVTLSRIS